MNPHAGNALWLVSALPLWYLSPITNPLGAGVLSLIPFMGSLALAVGAGIGIVQRGRSSIYFLISPFLSECYVAVAGAMRGQLGGNSGWVPTSVFAVIQAAFLVWLLIFRLKGGRIAASALALFCASYALFAWFVGAMAFADSWL